MKKITAVLLSGIFMNCMLFNHLQAQQIVVDSSILNRITELENQAAYKKSGEDHFMVVGLATFGFAISKSTNTINGVATVTKANSFPDADHFEFSPMLLWRHGDKLLLEFEPSYSNNGLGVNWADISYFVAPNLIIRAGYFVLPFGTYSKRLAAGWINKLATDPMGIADMTPADYGVEVEGGLALGTMKLNYDIALSNGNQLITNGTNGNSQGTLASGNISDNNNNKTVTARLGLLPFSNSSLELGVSGMFGKVGDLGTDFQNVKGNMYAVDLNYVKNLSPILLNVKSQYNYQDIGKTNYINPVDTSMYTFNNRTNSFFAQCSIRPTGAQGIAKNFELAGRYTMYNTPVNSSFGADQHAITVGLNYWLNWRSVVRITYEGYTGNSTAGKTLGTYSGMTKTNTLFMQFSIQL